MNLINLHKLTQSFHSNHFKNTRGIRKKHRDLNMGLIYTRTKDGVMKMEREFFIQGTYSVKYGGILWTTKDFEFTYDFTISEDLMKLIPRDGGHTCNLKRN